MIKRLVKLTFRPDKTADFIDIFNISKNLIRNTEGCLHLELLNDIAHPHIFFTLSFWKNEAALEGYRQSELFRTTWAKTKVLFDDKPVAWTTLVLDELS
jgi:(4S)-4-hydroxy-5-phosphonooxypentane-2,3-dione isomerase